MAELTVLSPLSGQVWPLERVPDPVFAQKMVGDGLVRRSDRRGAVGGL
jgi:phosphocarrier protein FPr